jgi:hypothetical protein
MRIRSKTFKQWLLRNFDKKDLSDIATNGARMGFTRMSYYQDTSHLYHKFEKEIWDILVNEMKMSDCDNVFDFISQTFNNRSKEVETPNQFEAMLVWYVAERIASFVWTE